MDKKIIVRVLLPLILLGMLGGDSAMARTAPENSTAVAADASYKIVVVMRGDSLWKIAGTHCPDLNTRTAVDEMLRINKVGKYIYPGDKLKVPLNIKTKPSENAENQVSRGETGRELTFQATAYTHTGNRTATMTWPAEKRTIAVDPRVIPLNSRVYVSCSSWPAINGIYIAEDTGGRIKGNIIDVFMDSREKAVQWGRRSVQVRILE